MDKSKLYMGMRLKMFFTMFIMLVMFQIIIGLIFSNSEIYWSTVMIISVMFSVFGAAQYKRAVIGIPIEDKEAFKRFLREYLECAGVKIVSENKDTFILKPKFDLITYRWIVKEELSINLSENQATIVGPSSYVNKIKLIVDTN
ncbi:hypothetical protein Amet_1810 [Alkaliphilus metalliredigens QYMF]|uniref:Uncharacterized protein n=1 Tax=Alkaliphilus metalliredigens (strain QYMF) TaxID=293826 RepID=A6TP62_ALKMQ|nr:hypothetical protein [Alkaliphilus metalliredigens]ABR47980.1 hypothetical protein Amet_1810 [Alkaliphilus metalliredigens QYMF]